MAISIFEEHRRTRRDLCLAVARLSSIESVEDILCAVEELERYIGATGRNLSDREVHALLGESGDEGEVEDRPPVPAGPAQEEVVGSMAPEATETETPPSEEVGSLSDGAAASDPDDPAQEAVYAELARVVAASEACPRNLDLEESLSLRQGQASGLIVALRDAGRIAVERHGPRRRIQVEGLWTGWTGEAKVEAETKTKAKAETKTKAEAEAEATPSAAAQAEGAAPNPAPSTAVDDPSGSAVKPEPEPRVMIDPVPEARRFLMTRDHAVVVTPDGKYNVDQRKILTGPELVAMANRHRRELNMPALVYR